MKRRRPKPGTERISRPSGMSSRACDIAVSEMTGMPAEELCGYVLVTWTHPPAHPGKHELSIMPSSPDWDFARDLLERAVADLEEVQP